MAKKGQKKGKGDSGGGGGMMSMRAGFRRVTGVEKGPKKKVNPVWNVVSWILVVAMVAAAGFLLYRRFGG